MKVLKYFIDFSFIKYVCLTKNNNALLTISMNVFQYDSLSVTCITQGLIVVQSCSVKLKIF